MTECVDDYYLELPDGTIKQRNPFTGTQVWTVPGRGARPLGGPVDNPRPLTHADRTSACAFCVDRYLQTPPEKARLVDDPECSAPSCSDAAGAGGAGTDCDPRWPGRRLIRQVPADQLDATTAQFRRIPNLFEILPWQYWQMNHGLVMPESARSWQDEYLADPAGRAHVQAVLDARFRAAGRQLRAEDLSDDALRDESAAFFAGGHDVIVGRRHYTDDATTTADLAGSRTLSVAEHRAFIALTVATMGELYAQNPRVRFVVAFQNWLKPAGASFDHLHKQLVAIDELGTRNQTVLPKAVVDPDIYNRFGPDFAIDHGLVLARNEHALATVGFGHRYPSVEIWSTSALDQPWRMEPEEVDAMADLVHAVHVAVGPHVPCNEEWHHRPVGVGAPVPWRVNLKLRVSTLAGFEGGTKIYVNAISPASLTSRLLPEMVRAREAGLIAPMDLGDECSVPRGVLASTRVRG